MNFIKNLFAKKVHPATGLKMVRITTTLGKTRLFEVKEIGGDFFAVEPFADPLRLWENGKVGNFHHWTWEPA